MISIMVVVFLGLTFQTEQQPYYNYVSSMPMTLTIFDVYTADGLLAHAGAAGQYFKHLHVRDQIILQSASGRTRKYYAVTDIQTFPVYEIIPGE